MMRISIIAATVTGNRGAEAMLETTVGRLRERWPDVRFNVYSYYPDTDAALVSDPAIQVYSSTPASLVLVHLPFAALLGLLRVIGLGRLRAIFPAPVRALVESDALIDLAGVSFIDGREKFLAFNVLTILPAMMLGTPVFKLAQALGPFSNPANRFASRILRRCRLIVARGEGTAAHLAGLGLPEGIVTSAADVAFLFRDEYSLSSEGDDEVDVLTTRCAALAEQGMTVTGICPSAVIAAKAAAESWDYIGFVSAVASSEIAAGRGVLLFPNATRAATPEKLRNNDLPVIAEVRARLTAGLAPDAHGRILAVTGDVNAVGIRRLMRGCGCVAVSRFHAMVGALAAGTPTLVVGWSHKYLEVMRQFGMERYVFDYAQRDAEALAVALDALASDRAAVSEAISEHLPDVISSAESQFGEVEARLGR
ncbi:MAG: polysaccharide pyruvyl transferase family protein [Coriobacteriia bacterium]|nr:polysaccharide pyruvyl transferase family protein [Coriobacteriia bacterium]MBN2822704.1 polysaccharide pyruvyl transferase family protein [Coriobacteriia bacterium]